MVDFTKKATASIQQQIQDEARLAEPATYEVLSASTAMTFLSKHRRMISLANNHVLPGKLLWPRW